MKVKVKVKVEAKKTSNQHEDGQFQSDNDRLFEKYVNQK